MSPSDKTLTLIDEVLNTWGCLDVWVCSSGLGPPFIETTTPADLQKCFEANSIAPFFALKYGSPTMAKTTLSKRGAEGPKIWQLCCKQEGEDIRRVLGPCYTMPGYAALGVVRAGVTVLKGISMRMNCISLGQIDVSVSLNGFDIRGMTAQLPPAEMQSRPHRRPILAWRGLDCWRRLVGWQASLPVDLVATFTGANLAVDGGASTMCPLMVPMSKTHQYAHIYGRQTSQTLTSLCIVLSNLSARSKDMESGKSSQS
jgi:NAD(P)-dependent dehydrogenase (short-subunit alcohol dehydrogenase family)